MLRKIVCAGLICVFAVFSLSAQESLKILSYNIHHGNPPSLGAGQIDLPAIAKVINESGADIIGLQEVDVNVTRSGSVDQIKELADMTQTEYFFAKGIDLQGGEYGVAILSKLPIQETESFLLPMPKSGEQRVMAAVHVRTAGGTDVVFITTHLDLYEKNRIEQAGFIKEYAESNKDKAVILTGDLNDRPDSKVIEILDGVFTRSQIEEGYTFPEVNPNREIDYIMINDAVKAEVKEHIIIEEEYASDHRPLYVEYLLAK